MKVKNKMAKKKDLREKCDRCNKKAVYNLQNVSVLYECLKNGEYDKMGEWEGDSNEFFCEKHYELEMK